MTRRKPLPDAVVGRGFSTREALMLGATAKQLMSSDLHRPFHGARLPAGADTLRERCLALQSVTNATSFISHSTAARLYGVPLPWRLQRESTVHVTVERPNRSPQGPGVVELTMTVTSLEAGPGPADVAARTRT